MQQSNVPWNIKKQVYSSDLAHETHKNVSKK